MQLRSAKSSNAKSVTASLSENCRGNVHMTHCSLNLLSLHVCVTREATISAFSILQAANTKSGDCVGHIKIGIRVQASRYHANWVLGVPARDFE